MLRKRLFTWPIVTSKPRSQNLRNVSLKHNGKLKTRRNSKVDRTPCTLKMKKQPRRTSRKVPESNGKPNNITEELWWKDIHEPIGNIVEMIQNQFRILEAQEVSCNK